MNVLTCYKIVPEEQDIVVQKDRKLSFDRAEWKVGQYDLHAIEAGMQLVDAAGGRVSALSIGNKQLENSKLKKAVLSRGPEDLYLVMDEQLGQADTYVTARTLAAAIKKIGSVDVVICGEGSSDLYAQQVGAQLGQMLGAATLNAVSKITPNGDKLIVERTLENEIEILEVMLPAVISVTTDINLPRIPSMKEILAAGKKTVTQWGISEIGLEVLLNTTEIISTLAPEEVDRKQIILEGDSAEIVNQLFENIRKELL